MSPFLRAGARWALVEDELAPVLPVHLADLVAQLALEPVACRALQPSQLVLEAQHVLDAGEVEPELGRQPLDQAQPLEVAPRSRAACCPGVRLGRTRPFAS